MSPPPLLPLLKSEGFPGITLWDLEVRCSDLISCPLQGAKTKEEKAILYEKKLQRTAGSLMNLDLYGAKRPDSELLRRQR